MRKHQHHSVSVTVGEFGGRESYPQAWPMIARSAEVDFRGGQPTTRHTAVLRNEEISFFTVPLSRIGVMKGKSCGPQPPTNRVVIRGEGAQE